MFSKLFGLVATLGIIIGILLIIFRDKPSKENVWLALFFISNVLYAVLSQALFLNENRWIVNYFFPYFVTFNYSSGAFLYLYFRYKLNPYKIFKPVDLLHFAIPLLLFINSTPYVFLKQELKLSFLKTVATTPTELLKFPFLFLDYRFHMWGRPILALLYVIACSFLLYKSYRKDKYTYFSSFEMKYLWLLMILSFIHYYFSTVAVINFTLYPNTFTEGEDYYQWMIVPRASFVVMLLLILFFPQIIFQKFFPNTLPEAHNISKKNKADSIASIPQYDLEQIGKVVSVYLQEKPFRRPGFSLFNFSEETKIPQHQLTYFLKVVHEQTFNEFKNQLRIQHAIELIESGKAKNQTLESISIECGYRSRTNFIDAFKKITGKTPSDYLKA